MNLRIKSYYEALGKNNIFPPWTTAFQPSHHLMMSQYQTDTIVSLRETEANEMLKAKSVKSSAEATECKSQADAVIQALKAYYHQPDALGFSLHEAIEALVTLIEC